MQRAERVLIVLLIVCAVLTVILVGILVAYNFMRTVGGAPGASVAEAVWEAPLDGATDSYGEEAVGVITLPGSVVYEAAAPELLPTPPDTQGVEAGGFTLPDVVVTAETRVVFERNYVAQGEVHRSEEGLPHFAVGMDRDSLDELYADWDIAEFSPEVVVMRRYILEGSYFSIGEMDGFVAAFRHEEGNPSLWSLTNTPMVALPQGEQERIREGIIIHSEEALMRILQDFDS